MKKLNFNIPAYVMDMLPFFFISLVVFIFFSPVIFTSSSYFIGDIYTQFFPWKYFMQKSMQSGVAPFWNPLVFSGVPFAADIQKGVFYPLSIFFIIFNFSTAFKIYIISHFLLMGFSTYSLLRRFSFSKTASIAGMIVFLFNTFTLTKINFLSALGSYALMPLILLTFLNFLSKKEIPYLILFVLSYSLSILAGHPPTVFYTTLLLVAFWIYENTSLIRIFSFKKLLNPLYFVIISGGAVLLLSIPQTGLFYEMIRLSSRGSSFEYSAAAATSMNFINIWNFIMPAGINGFSTNFLMDWISYSMGVMNYFSITAVFLLFLSLFYPKNGLYKFSLGLMTFAILMALGKNTPVHSWFFTFFPFFSQLRHPGFAMTLFVVPLSIIIAFTVDHIITFTVTHVPFISKFSYTAGFSSKVYKFFSYAIIAFTVVLLLVILNKDMVMKNYNLSPKTQFNFVLGLFAFLLIFSINFLLFYFKERALISKSFYIFTLGFMLLFEFTYFISAVNPVLFDTIYDRSKISNKSIEYIQSSNYKFLHTESAATNCVTSGTTPYEAQLDFISQIPSNTGIIYGLKDAGGYNPVEPRLYASYLKTVIKNDTVLDFDKLNLLNVKYLFALSDITNPNFEKVYDGHIKIFKNLKALPLFYTSASKDTVDLIVGQYSYSQKNEFDFSMYKIDLTIEKPGYFIFSNNMYPGWSVYVDNKSAVIERCFGIFMGVYVSKGPHSVTYMYTPTNLRLYLMLFFIAIMIIILFGAAWLIYQKDTSNK